MKIKCPHCSTLNKINGHGEYYCGNCNNKFRVSSSDKSNKMEVIRSNQKKPTIRQLTSKKWFIPVTIGSAVLILLFLCGCGPMIGFLSPTSPSSEADPSIEEVEALEENAKQTEGEEVKALISPEDFNQKSIKSLIDKYGKPDYREENELPVVSKINWETESYEIWVEYKKDEETVYGADIYLKDHSCNRVDISEDKLKEVLPLVNLEYNPTEWKKDLRGINQTPEGYINEDLKEWEYIMVRCSKLYGAIEVTLAKEL